MVSRARVASTARKWPMGRSRVERKGQGTDLRLFAGTASRRDGHRLTLVDRVAIPAHSQAVWPVGRGFQAPRKCRRLIMVYAIGFIP